MRNINILLILILLSCSNPKTHLEEQKILDNVGFSFNGLQKAYLDSAKSGVTLEIQYYDKWLTKRDSIKFYWMAIDQDFNRLEELQRLDLKIKSDSLAQRHVRFGSDSLPSTFMYEVGAIYMSPPESSDSPEWKLDTIITDFFVFNIYQDADIFQQIVDSFGLDPTVFVREQNTHQ